MQNNKKRKAMVVAVMALCSVVTLAIGTVIGYKLKDTALGMSVVQSKTPVTPSNAGSSPIIDLQPVPENSDGGYDTTEIFEKVNPSVVNISVYSENSISAVSAGTGIIMSEDGYIITNAHVVEKGTSVNVIFNDESQLRGTVVGSDSETDLAVIKVDATGLKAAEFGDSNRLKIGERVVAIGNAGGLSGTCTQGIVSGLNRNVDSGYRSLSLIQTSAAINPGNSGGPLVNRFGQVVGITSSKVANVNYEGIGFAIPISDAVPILQSIIDNGYVAGRAILGVSVKTLNASNGPINGLPSYGAYIASISEGSYLPTVGVRERDVIIEANGREIRTSDDLMAQLVQFTPGQMINLGIYRPETQEVFHVDVMLIESK